MLSNPSVAELAALLSRVEPARPPVTPRTAPGTRPPPSPSRACGSWTSWKARGRSTTSRTPCG
ncbi:hypothetical protein HFP43_21025 [Streptomyces sp. SJ1-7]|nr:hypothetical protein [Streptomyces sp. SJ1-7]